MSPTKVLLSQSFGTRPIRTDVFDTVTNMSNSAKTAVLVVAGLVAVVLIVKVVWKAGGALGAVVSASLVAMIFLWAINNVSNSSVQDQITDTVIPAGAGLPTPIPTG